VPSGCGLIVGASSLPSGVTIRFRPPRRWKRIGIRTTNVVPSSFVSTSASCRFPLNLLPQLPYQACEALSPDPHIQRVLPDIDPLEEQLHDPSLLGGRCLLKKRLSIQLPPEMGLLAGAVVRPMR
jgi:hypothetical protein